MGPRGGDPGFARGEVLWVNEEGRKRKERRNVIEENCDNKEASVQFRDLRGAKFATPLAFSRSINIGKSEGGKNKNENKGNASHTSHCRFFLSFVYVTCVFLPSLPSSPPPFFQSSFALQLGQARVCLLRDLLGQAPVACAVVYVRQDRQVPDGLLLPVILLETLPRLFPLGTQRRQ